MSLRKLAITFLILLLYGCGPSNEWVSETVRRSIEEKLTNDPTYSEYKLIVKSVTVVHESEGRYQGLVTVSLDDEEYQFPVTITADKENAIWRSEPGSFTFLFKHQMKKLEGVLGDGEAKEISAPSVPARSIAPPSDRQWSVSVGNVSSKEDAVKFVSNLKEAGLVGYSKSDEKFIKIYAGPYNDRATAHWVKDKLAKQIKTQMFVFEHKQEKTGVGLLVSP